MLTLEAGPCYELFKPMFWLIGKTKIMTGLCSGCQELTHLPIIIQHAKNISAELETG